MVVCKSCDYKGESGKFCPQCGSPLEEVTWEVTETEAAEPVAVSEEPDKQQEKPTVEEKPSVEKKPLDKKLLTRIAIAAIAVIAVITLFRVIFGGKSSGFELKDNTSVAFQYVNGQIMIFTAEGVLEGPECSYYNQTDATLDSSKIVLIDNESNLYLINEKGYSEVDSDVSSAVISTTGEGIAYIRDYKDGYGDLYLYDVKKEKSTKVESEVKNSGYVISPDGKSVAYMDDKERCHVYVNGKEREDSIKEARALAISNDGKYFYYGKNDNLYVLPKKGDAEKLASDAEQITFNADFTQMMYSYNGKTYFCNKGKEAEETITTKGTCEVVVPVNAVYENAYVALYNEYSGVSVMILGKEDLSNLVCRLDGGLYYIGENMVAEKIVSSYSSAQVSDDGESLIYYKGDNLYKVKDLTKSLDAEEIASGLSMSYFTANGDLSRVYYYDYEEEEICVFNGKKAEALYDDNYYAMQVVGDNLYFLADYSNGGGTVYVSKNGGKKQELSTSDEVSDFYVINGRVYYYVAEDDELFWADGTKEKSVVEEYRN